MNQLQSRYERELDKYSLERRSQFKALLKKTKKTALDVGTPNFIAATYQDKYYITFRDIYFVIGRLGEAKPDDFFCQFNPGNLPDPDFLKHFKKNKLIDCIDYRKGVLKTKDLDNFMYHFFRSKFFDYEWHWSDQIDMRLGGKKGYAGKKRRYGGLKTSAVKMPTELIDDLKVVAEFLAENQGKYDLKKLKKLLK